MQFLWWALIVLCLGFGFLGCFINKIPGPVGVVIAVLLAYFAVDVRLDGLDLGLIIGLAVVSIILSKVLVKAVKKLHTFSKRGSWGTTIGSFIGLGILCAPVVHDSTVVLILILILGLVIVPFVFAFLLELTNKQGASESLKCAGAATGAYLSDTFLKLVVFAYAIYVLFV